MRASSPSRKRAHWYPVGALTLLFFAGWVALVINAPIEALLRDWNSDDSFYYLQIARHLGDGMPSVDGRNLTNGYHPLWLVWLTALQSFFDSQISLVYAAKVSEVFLVLSGAVMWMMICRSARWVCAMAPIWLWMAMKDSVLLGGLETGIWFAGVGLVGITLRRVLAESCRRRDYLNFGLALALVGLARIESFALGGILLVMVARERMRANRPVMIGLPTIILLAVAALYFCINIAIFDGLAPISGLVKQWWGEHHVAVVDRGFWQELQAMLDHHRVREGLIWGVPAALLYLGPWRNVQHPLRPLLILLVALALLHVVRLVWFSWTTRSPFSFYPHYFVTGRWIRFGVLFCVGWALLRGLDRARILSSVGGSVCVALTPLMGAAVDGSTQLFKKSLASVSQSIDWEILSYKGALAANRLLPANARVGSFDSGVFGYFCRRPVTNLDGLVNNRDFFRLLQQGAGEDYLRSQRIRYLANAIHVNDVDMRAWLSQRLFVRAPEGSLTTVWRGQDQAHVDGMILSFRILRYDSR